jgi:hypothetical protein
MKVKHRTDREINFCIVLEDLVYCVTTDLTTYCLLCKTDFKIDKPGYDMQLSPRYREHMFEEHNAEWTLATLKFYAEFGE